MENWINLDNLPRRNDGKIDWKNCNHNLVEFCYRNNVGSLYVEKRINSDYLIVLYDDKFIELSIQSLLKICLGKLYNFSIKDNYRYNIDDIINTNHRYLKILERKRMNYSNGKTCKSYRVKCLKCGNEFDISEANLDRGDGCNVCSNHKVKIGLNDLWTTRPDVASMLKDKDLGYTCMEFSNILADFVCPKCGKYIGKSYIHNVSRFGLSCKYCGRGISYPNRLMGNLLEFFDEDFDSEVYFKWCHFPNYYDENITSYGRYDFVVENKKLIIEMDGGYGHGNDPHPNSIYTKEELIYRDKMKDKLALENGYSIIRVDCNYSSKNRLKYCSNNILNSELSIYYDFNNIDWNYINNNCI